MIPSCCLPLLVHLAAATPSAAEPGGIGLGSAPRGFGLGPILGEPTGLGFLWRPSGGTSTFDAAVAWSVPDDRLHIHADWLLTLATYRDPATPSFSIPFYTGVGPRLRMGWKNERGSDAALLGVRIPFGMVILPNSVPVDGFVEIVPVLTLYPETSLDFDAALGARIFLGRRSSPPTATAAAP